MLIVCPNCATSYMIDQAAVGPAGRTVRCARCKATWFAGGPKAAPDVTAFVDNVDRGSRGAIAGSGARPSAASARCGRAATGTRAGPSPTISAPSPPNR